MSDNHPRENEIIEELLREYGTQTASGRAAPQPEPPLPQRPHSAARILSDTEKRMRLLAVQLVVCFAVTVAGLLLALYGALELHWLPGLEERTRIGWLSLLLLAVAALSACNLLHNGLRQALHFRFGSDTLALVLTAAACAEAFSAVSAGRMPLCAAASAELFAALWARKRQQQALHTAARVLLDAEEAAFGVVRTQPGVDGAITCTEADGAAFASSLEAEDPQRSWMRVYVPLTLAVTLALAVVFRAYGGFLCLWARLLLAASPLGLFFGFSLPSKLLAERLAQQNAALCGWHGARVLNGAETVFFDETQLFPRQCRTLSGVKVFGTQDSQQFLSYTAAVLRAAGWEAAALLWDGSVLPPVRALRCFDDGGYSAEISGETVMVGTLDFLRRMGVHLEEGTRISQALYVSIRGELSGVVALRYEVLPEVRSALAAFSTAGGQIPVLIGSDIILTPELLRVKFRLPLEELVCPPLRERIRLSRTRSGEQGAVMEGSGLPGLRTVCQGAAALLRTVKASLLLSTLSGGFGLAVLILCCRFRAVPPLGSILAYLALCAAAVAALAGRVRRV